MAVLGIDTSCYRTSVALVENGVILRDERRLIEVKSGERGLRQSEGLFQHVRAIGEIIETAFSGFNGSLDAVCVSSRPRDVEGSYMPVFTAGEAVARSLAAAGNLPLFKTSHQQGHIRAAMFSSDIIGDDFLAVHLSGGTTELLRVYAGLRPDSQMRVELIGKTTDLNAGQLVDRIGVRLGLPFPAGAHLERMAASGTSRSLAPTSVIGDNISLSGAEARLMRLIDAGERPTDVAREVYSFLERTLAKWMENAVRKSGIKTILMTGGVSSSEMLKSLLAARIKKRGSDMELYWADPGLSGDNAVGVALIGWDMLKGVAAHARHDIS
ncbi:MAG: O-sialoglycoprotein endopeptidase [Clostridia bacterium]|nr:O-sialoglycoprotein endopeptidase [Clostridia bacterium]